MKIYLNCRRKQKGLTLVEILVVLGIFAIIAVMGANLFFSLLKASTKSKMVTRVKQNGDYAINVMERVTRNAVSLGEESGGPTLILEDLSGQNYVFTCLEMGGKNVIRYQSGDDSGSLTSDELTVASCGHLFTITEAPEEPPEVAISFTLQTEEGGRPEETVAVIFETTVVLRNY